MDEVHVTLILSKFDEINRQLADDRRDSAESRRRMYERMDVMQGDVRDLKQKSSETAKAVEDLVPKVKRFADMEAQAKGAGRLGRALWWIGGVLIGIAAYLYSIKAQLLSLFR